MQLIDVTARGTKMRKGLGEKRVEILEADRDAVVDQYANMKESETSKVFDNADFAYWQITLEQPLRANFAVTSERIQAVREAKTLAKIMGLLDALASFDNHEYLDRTEFKTALGSHLGTHGVGLNTTQWKKLLSVGVLAERDERGIICTDTKGKPEADAGLRDTEIVPFGWGGNVKCESAATHTIKEYFDAEVAPYAPGAWVDHTKTKVGYEVAFLRTFGASTRPETVSSHWVELPLLASATEVALPNTGMKESNLLSLSYGRIVRKDINTSEGLLPASFETYQIVEPGMVVFRFTDLQNDQRSLRSGLVTERGIITSAYVAVDPHGFDSRFFAYLMRAYDQAKVFYGMGAGVRQSIGFKDVKRLPVPVPTESEQERIADFLDRETACIDGEIAEAERQVELAKEGRAALIAAAVTGQIEVPV